MCTDPSTRTGGSSGSRPLIAGAFKYRTTSSVDVGYPFIGLINRVLQAFIVIWVSSVVVDQSCAHSETPLGTVNAFARSTAEPPRRWMKLKPVVLQRDARLSVLRQLQLLFARVSPCPPEQLSTKVRVIRSPPCSSRTPTEVGVFGASNRDDSARRRRHQDPQDNGQCD